MSTLMDIDSPTNFHSTEADMKKQIRIAVYSLDRPHHACARLRLLGPAAVLADQLNIRWGVKGWETGRVILEDGLVEWADMIIVQRFFPRAELWPLIEKICSSGKPIIYETDDLIIDMPATNPYKAMADASRPYILQLAARAAAITVSTEEIKKAFLPYNDNIHVLPNLLDEQLWSIQSPKPIHGEPVVIGYAATPDHRSDLELIEKVLLKISKKYGSRAAFCFMGCSTRLTEALPGSSFIQFDEGYESYARAMQKLGIHIGLAPLSDNRFNRCKSNIKWLEYSACGIAGVYADLPPYGACIENGRTGLLVRENPDEWIDALSALIDSPDRRLRIAREARDTVFRHYALSKSADIFLDVYRSTHAGKRTNGAEDSRYLNAHGAKTSGKPRFSVVIVTWNRAKMLDECLQALFSSLYYIDDTEVIVADNGSTDHTSSIIKKYPIAKYIRESGNTGLELYRKAFAAAEGRRILDVDDDVLEFPKHFDKIFEDYFRAYPDYGFLGLNVVSNELTNGAKPDDSHYSPDKRGDKLVQEGPVGGWCACIKSEDFEKINGFGDQPLSMANCEDGVLNRRVRAIGKRAGIIKDHKCLHACGPMCSKLYGYMSRDIGKYDLSGMSRFVEWYKQFNGMTSVHEKHVKHVNTTSIVIPLFNQVELTKECLNSIFNNTPYGQYEIILIDNASTDETASFLEEIAGSLSFVRTITNAKNLGFAAACNQGFRQARGKFILFLNNDTVVTPGWLDALIYEMESDATLGIVGACLLYPESSLIQHAGVAVGWYRDKLFPYHKHRLRPLDRVPEAQQSNDFKAVTGACMLARRELSETMGPFDEGYRNGYEDIDFCFKASSAGYRVRYCAQSRVYHHESMSKGRHDHDGENLKRLNDRWLGVVQPDEDHNQTVLGLCDIWAREELSKDPDNRKSLSMLFKTALQRGDYEEAREWRLKALGIKPLVSIVIPTYNNLALTKQCLESIPKTSSGLPIEIICVDNGSSDGSVEFLRQEDLNEKIVLINNGENLGFAKACNQGARIASGEYLVFLNNDTIALDGWLLEMIKCMEADKSVGMVGSKLLYPEGGIQHAGVAFGGDGIPFHIYRFADADAPYVNKTRELAAVTGACILMGRTLFLELNGFDERYENGFEDIDLCLRVKEARFKILYCHKSVLYHQESVSAGRFSKTMENYRYFVGRWGGKLPVGDDKRLCAEDGTDLKSIRHLEVDMRQGKPYSRKTIIDYRAGATPLPDRCAKSSASFGAATPPQEKLVSIIVLSLNQWGWTRACLESVKKHTSLPYEIIVVDNGSSEETVRALVSYCSNDPCVSVILNERNKGFSGGNNLGLSLAKGDYALLLNNDALATAGWLEGMIEVLDKHPEAGIVGPMSNYVAGAQIVESARYDNTAEMEAFASDRRRSHRGESAAVSMVIGFCMLIRRSVIEVVGGLDELFGIGNFEDMDFSFRAALAGFQIRIAQDVFVHHQGSLTFKAEKVDYLRIMRKNWELFKAKWGLEPDAELGSKRIEIKKTDALRQRIPLPLLAKTHEAQAESRLWVERSQSPIPWKKSEEGDAPHKNGESALGSAASPSVIACNGRPQVSIIIPTYQNASLTRQCVEGILHNTANVAYEIIIADNHSTDGTASYLQEMQSKGLLKALINPSNMGFAHACNQGAQAAQSPFLLFLNNDTFPKEGWLPPLLQTALGDERIGVVGAKLLYPDGRVQHAGMALIHHNKGERLQHPIPGHPHRLARSDDPEVNRRRELDMVTGACILLRRDLFFLLGGFDEVFKNGVEDVDLCLRARYAGYKVAYQPESVVIHHEGQSPGRFDRQHVCRNLEIYFARWERQFDDAGVLITPSPPRIIRSQASILLDGPEKTVSPPRPPEDSKGKGLRIC